LPLPEELRQRRAALEARIADLTKRLQLAGAKDAQHPVALSRPPSLRRGTVLLEYFLSGDDILRFVADEHEVLGEILPQALPEVERLLRALRVNLDATLLAPVASREPLVRQVRMLLGRLYRILLGGLEGLDAYESLAVVPHGSLHYLPFQALFDGERYLLERLTISYAPSAALYEICCARRSHRGAALVLAHSNGGLLPSALAEAEAVAAVLGAPVYAEAAATRARIEVDGAQAGVVHIAAHGNFRADAPLFSAIELADGFMTTADVFGLHLPAALVVLSACETWRAIVGGDELVGMARAFLYAGASTLLLSQWRVDDAATATIMERFYRKLRAGAGSAAGLRSAQS
jgi:hypothetical protein